MTTPSADPFHLSAIGSGSVIPMMHDQLTLIRLFSAAASENRAPGDSAGTLVVLAAACVLFAMLLVRRALQPFGALLHLAAGFGLAVVALLAAVILLAVAALR